MINVHEPTLDKAVEDTEQFYEDIRSVADKVKKGDAKFGKKRVQSNITSKHSTHKEANGNGEMLREFAFANNIIINSTQFPHKKINKATWISPDQITQMQIDDLLVNAYNKEVIQGIRSMRDSNIDSDDFL